jgi:predicted RNase H-like nuclease (RuvC/YqgF family)
MEDGFFAQQEIINSHLDDLSSRLSKLEAFKQQAEGRLDRGKSLVGREEAHKEKERHQEIETVLIDKYSYNERQIQELKKEIEKLTQQLKSANKDNEDLRHQLHLPEHSHISTLKDKELIDSLNREHEQQAFTISRLEREMAATSQLLQATSD